MTHNENEIPAFMQRTLATLKAWGNTTSSFILTILGFSFWFFMAVPFASHRETYSWLATIKSHHFSYAFANSMSVTYRPLSQAATWLAFLLLNPGQFPTSIGRQTAIQMSIYALFVVGWWLIYRATIQRHLFSLIAFVAGGVFFSGYVQLFHVYGLMYVPVMLMLGAIISCHARGIVDEVEGRLAGVAMLLALWHPFATALFLGFEAGFCLETLGKRKNVRHIQAVIVLIVGTLLSLGLGVVFARPDAARMSLSTRLVGFLVSYQTNEVSAVASLVALLLSIIVIFSMEGPQRLKLTASAFAAIVSFMFVVNRLPVLLIWIGVASLKLVRMRSWSLLGLLVTAVLLPFGGGIGTPVFALFAIIIAIYVTSLDWCQGEKVLSVLRPRYVVGLILAVLTVVLMGRSGINIPIITTAARPLLVERERTYQLETILEWLHNSEYCSDELTFVANAGSPIDSLDNIVTRRNRPPAGLDDVNHFWRTVLCCAKRGQSNDKRETAIITFGTVPTMSPVFAVPGKYAGEAAVVVSTYRAKDGLHYVQAKR